MLVTDIPVGRLVPYARNPRNNAKAIDAVKASIAEFGFRQPIVVDENMVVIVGHTRLEAAKAKGGRIIAVGTTSLRLLETASRATGQLRPFVGETDIFITPGFRFRAVDILMTNFHLPKSTLFMLVCAFTGTARMREAYAHAIARGYRFYSYGDATLLHRSDGAP